MNKQICIIILLLTCRICNAQNLVPNGSFEQYSGCPFATGQIDSALFWFNPSPFASPDYFHQCSSSSMPFSLNVPNSSYGFQFAHSGGAFSGIVLWSLFTNQYREYIEVPLTSNLTSGMCYHFEMYVNVPNDFKYATDDIGIYFSDTIVTASDNDPLPYTAQINNATGNITDTLGWVLVEGDYTALGGENYLIIGNFKDDANTDTTLMNNNATWSHCYVYIDDVSLMLCTTGISESNEIANRDFYPNPFNDKLTLINKDNELSEIVLYDIASRKLMQQQFISSVTLNTEQLAKGVYLYEVRNKIGVIKKGKVVKD